MKIELVLGDVLRKPIERDMWQIVVDYMHGDADADTTETFKYREEADAIEAIRFLSVMSNEDFYDDTRDMGHKAHSAYLAEKLPDMDLAVAERLYDCFRIGDCTCDGQYDAACTGFTVTYFNKDGTEIEVNAYGDGKLL